MPLEKFKAETLKYMNRWRIVFISSVKSPLYTSLKYKNDGNNK